MEKGTEYLENSILVDLILGRREPRTEGEKKALEDMKKQIAEGYGINLPNELP